MRHQKIKCIKCDLEFGSNNINKHIVKCEGKKNCPVCEKEFVGKTKTCSYSCSNKLFRTGENNGNWKEKTYRSTCFLHHKKECVICGEKNIVAVHHMNENKNDNRPENLIPLCPTHHQYVHSNYKHMVLPKIEKYIKNYLGIA